MSRQRLIFCIALAALALLWSSTAFIGYNTRFDHRAMIATIRNGDDAPDTQELRAAIADDVRALDLIGCNRLLHTDLALLLAQNADVAMTPDENADEEAPLKQMQDGLIAHLNCSPTDGKAWLDFAMVNTLREGLTPRSLAAYRMSQEVAPGESWLAEKRLSFALRFRPVFDAKSLAAANRDIAVLGRAHPNRMSAVMNEAGVKDAKELSAIFASANH